MLKNSKFNKVHAGHGQYWQKGALLLELLIVISLIAIILFIGTQAVYVSLQGNKISGDRDVATGLATEALEAVRGVTEERWQNIYDLAKTTEHYKTILSSGKWVLETGDETIILNDISYTRYIVIENTCRDDLTRNITGVGSCGLGSSNDTSTQKVTVTVSWQGAEPVVISKYFFRWKNQICNQASWSGAGGSGDTLEDCSTTTYDTKDSSIDVSTGSIKLQ